LTVGRILSLGSDTVYSGRCPLTFQRGVLSQSSRPKSSRLGGLRHQCGHWSIGPAGNRTPIYRWSNPWPSSYTNWATSPHPSYLKIRTFPNHQIVLFFLNFRKCSNP
jgi:hypothetical protein